MSRTKKEQFWKSAELEHSIDPGPVKFLPRISGGGGPRAARWRGSLSAGRTPPPRFAWSPSPANAGEEFGKTEPNRRPISDSHCADRGTPPWRGLGGHTPEAQSPVRLRVSPTKVLAAVPCCRTRTG